MRFLKAVGLGGGLGFWGDPAVQVSVLSTL